MEHIETLRLLATYSPVGQFITDPGGSCIYMNEKAEQLCGRNQGQTLGKHWAQALMIDAADVIMKSWSISASAGYKGVFRVFNGESSRWVEVRTAPVTIRETGFEGHVGIVLETAEAWESERRIAIRDAITHILADSPSIDRAQQRILAEAGGLLGWRFGVFWHLDEQARGLRPATTWGASPAESFEAATRNSTFPAGVGLPGRVWSTKEPAWIADVALDTNFPRNEAASRAGFHGAFAFPILLDEEILGVIEFFSNEVWGPNPDLLQLVGAIGSQVGQFIDRKQKESDLWRSNHRLRLVAEHIREVLWVLDPVERSFVYLSPSFDTIWRRPAERVLRRPDALLETVHPADRQRVQAFLARIFEGKEAEEEFRIIRPDRTVRWIRDLAFPVMNESGRPEQVVGLALDITDRLEREQHRARAVKAEAIAALAGGLAHDLNNLLTGVLGNVSLAIDLLGERHPAIPHLHGALVSSERAAEVVAQMLAYSGQGRIINAEINLSRAVTEFVGAARASVPRNVQVEMHLARDIPAVRGDPHQIQQLLGDIYYNAVEAIGAAEGKITITTGTEHLTQGASDMTDEEVPGGYVFVRISDTGSGIDEQIQPRIFDPFFTTKFVGRGLGLAAAHGIMTAHAGTIRVSSQSGRGSTFTCLFPVGRHPGRG